MDEVGSKQLFEPLLNPKIGYNVFMFVFGAGAVGILAIRNLGIPTRIIPCLIAINVLQSSQARRNLLCKNEF